MKIIVISLTRSTERRERMKKQLDDAQLPFEFFDAVDASVANFKYSERSAPEKTIQRLGYQLIDSEIACFASHFCLWEKCVELNEPILVLEDSCDLTPLFSSHLQLLPSLVDEYKFIKLFSMYDKTYSDVAKVNKTTDLVYYHERTCGTQA